MIFHENINNDDRNYGYDVLKALSILLVLIWHLNPLIFSVEKGVDIIVKVPGFLVSLFNSQLTLIAVPIFILVSLQLFYTKSHSEPASFKKRIR